jgi:DNA-binding NarL/FixJ family response regulator
MRILVVDDHALFREGVVSLLAGQEGITIVGEAGCGAEAEEKAMSLCPDLILMDIGLPDKTGLEVTRSIVEKNPDIKIVILSVHETDDFLFSAITAGASGYLLKNMPSSQILASLKALENGESALSPTMTNRIIKEFRRLSANKEPAPSEYYQLTPREVEVFWMLVNGASNLEIAGSLMIAETTVKAHVSSILSKLKLNNRYDAARYVRQHGISNQV